MSKSLQVACVSILSGSLLIGCGEGGNGPAPKLTVVSSVPQNKSTGASVDQPLTIEFAEPINPSSVSGETIMLMPGSSGMENMPDMAGMDMTGAGAAEMDHSNLDMSNMTVIPGTAACDPTSPDCRKIKFTPLMSLAWGQQYHVMVHNLMTRSGKRFSGEHVVPLEFTTAYVMEIKSERNLHDPSRTRITETNYQSGGSGQQRPIRLTRKVTTQSTGQVQMTYYNQTVGQRQVDVRLKPGMGLAGFNSANAATEIDSYTYMLMEAGKMVGMVMVNGAGADAQWGTADDLVSSYTVRGEEHGTHRLTASYRAATPVAVNPLTIAALKAAPGFTMRRATLGFFEVVPPSNAPRLKKQIRFTSFGANNKMDIDPSGNKALPFDDVIDEYVVYEYNGQHGARSARKEYEGANLTLTEADALTGYRVYKTANDPSFGNAVGMLRVGEITYSSVPPGTASVAITPQVEDSLFVKEIELNFYCKDTTTATGGAYESFEIEAGPVGGQPALLNGGAMKNSTFPDATIESYLAPTDANIGNCSIPPDAAKLQAMGLTLQIRDIDTNKKY